MSYSFAQHERACREAALSGQILEQFVQVRRSDVVFCARLRSPLVTVDGVQLWMVEPLQVVPWRAAPVGSVRPCSGVDGRCVCAGELGGPAAAAAGGAA